MKKLIFLLSLVLASFMTVNAQTRAVLPMQSDLTVHKLGIDTGVNAATVTQVIHITGNKSLLTFQIGVTKLTGTPGGSVKLWGSNDNVIWDYATTATDTLAIGNVAAMQPKTWKFINNPFQYYKAVYKFTGTQTAKAQSAVLVGP